ncbi:MAG: hypothetical protein JWO31_3476 [Phycisphaerales bacterium]|nr:hypothetical protein [Phycisphaerales bacterium]
MLERKGLGIRVGAWVIDLVAMLVAAVIVNIVVSLVIPRLAGLFVLAVVCGYAFIEIATGQSPGKMALKLKVAREDGAPAAQDQMVRRTVIKYSPLLVHYGIAALTGLIGVGVIGFLGALVGGLGSLALGIILFVMSWKPMELARQAFWDLQANTAVFGPPAAATAPFTPAGSAGFAPIMTGQPVPPVPAAAAVVPPTPQA